MRNRKGLVFSSRLLTLIVDKSLLVDFGHSVLGIWMTAYSLT